MSGSRNLKEDFKEKLINSKLCIEKHFTSRVIKISRSNIVIEYLSNVKLNYKVKSENNILIGFIYSVNEFDIDVILIGKSENLNIFDTVLIEEKCLSISTTVKCNQILNSQGECIYELEDNEETIEEYTIKDIPIFREAKLISERRRLGSQIITGSTVIDTLYPIYYGQKMIIIGDQRTYKTSLIVDLIINNHNNHLLKLDEDMENKIFIYVSIGQRASNFNRTFKKLREHSIKNIIYIASTSYDFLGSQLLAPYTAMSIAEEIASTYNKDVVVIIDDISKHAICIKELSLLCGNIPSRDCYPSDIFYLHSSLLERACCIENGGTVTCLPIVETIYGDLTSYIPTNLISITDGQIYMDSKLISHDIKYPISTELSVSRIGSDLHLSFFKNNLKDSRKILSIYNSSKFFYSIFKESCDVSISNSIKEGLITRTFMYDCLYNDSNVINQVINSTMLEKRVNFNSFNLLDVENNRHLEYYKGILKLSYEYTESLIEKQKLNLLELKVAVSNFLENLTIK